MSRAGRFTWGIVAMAVCGLAVALRAHDLHRGLIYPDGFDYLLMARGIAHHLVPTLRLGPGGAMFVPPPDAALKPLFPALVALLSPLSSMRSAADEVTILSGAALAPLAGLLALRMTASRPAAIVVAAAALASPALRYWSAFVGPDPLAPALALGAAIAVCSRRHGLAGVLGGLCIATRPEWSLVLVGVAVAGLTRPQSREAARDGLLGVAFTLAVVLIVLRPPLAAPPGGLGLFFAALAAAVALQIAVAVAADHPPAATALAALMLAAVTGWAVSGRSAALTALLRDEWPLLLLAVAGVLRGLLDRRREPLILLAAVVTLGATYGYRNAGSERYLAELLPLVCVAVGWAATALPISWRRGSGLALSTAGGSSAGRRPLCAGLALCGGAVALGAVLAAARPAPAVDTFSTLAPGLAAAPSGPLISAAPDAYGVLLPDRPQLQLRPGLRGLVLLDGAQRAYQPELSARGAIVARWTPPAGFERPDGVIDHGPAVLVRGVVTAVKTG
jgi:hypothetical protein